MRIHIIGEISMEAYLEFSKKMDAAAKLEEDVIIELSSTGGNQYAALAYYSKIRSYPNTVNIEVYGPAFSAATLILSAGYHRIAHPGSYFYVHESGFEEVGDMSTESFKREARNNLQFEWHWETLMSKGSELSKEQWRKLSKRDTYFNAKQALEYGLIDEIKE